MSTLRVLDFGIYRWRYAIGYTVLAVAFIALLVIASLFIPGGTTSREMASAVASDAVSIKNSAPQMVVNLPYYLLQKTGFYLFGVHDLTIKLPSIILAFFSALGMIMLLSTWFKRNVAVLTALVGLTAGPFLVAAQSGTPDILYLFWPTWLLLAAVMIGQDGRFRLLWKLGLFVVIALSLYTPLSIYILIAAILAVIFHPHLRYLLNNLSKVRLAIGGGLGLLLIAPLLYAIYKDSSVGLQLLGVPETVKVLENLKELAFLYGSFLAPQNGLVMAPVYLLPAVLLILLGIYRMITIKYTARNYLLSAWLLLLIPVLIVSPSLVNVTLLPFLLLIGYGIDFLIQSWYRLFPHNPYARVAGLVPLVVLMTSLTLSGIDRFMYGFIYGQSSELAAIKDLRLLDKELTKGSYKNVTLYVAPSSESFYHVAARYNKAWDVTHVTSSKPANPAAGNTLVAAHDVHKNISLAPIKVLASPLSEKADRFYLYKNDAE